DLLPVIAIALADGFGGDSDQFLVLFAQHGGECIPWSVGGPADGSLFRQFLQAQPNKLRRLSLLTSTTRGRGNRGRRLRRAVTEIDQRGDRVRDRARRAVVVE